MSIWRGLGTFRNLAQKVAFTCGCFNAVLTQNGVISLSYFTIWCQGLFFPQSDVSFVTVSTEYWGRLGSSVPVVPPFGARSSSSLTFLLCTMLDVRSVLRSSIDRCGLRSGLDFSHGIHLGDLYLH